LAEYDDVIRGALLSLASGPSNLKPTIGNGNIKTKPTTSEKWVTVTSPDVLFKHGIDVDYKQMGCGKILNN